MNLGLIRRLSLLLMGLGLIVWSRAVGAPGIAGVVLVTLGLFDIFRALRRPAESHSRELDAVLEHSEELRRTNPAAADQLLDTYFEKQGAQTAEERNQLRQRAPYDLEAAKRLETVLRRDLDGHRFMRRRVIPAVPDDKRRAAVAELDQLESQTRAELDGLRMTIRKLKA